MWTTIAEDKAFLERMAQALEAAPDGMTWKEMLTAVEGLRLSTCKRLLPQLIGQGIAIASYESRYSDGAGRRRSFHVYRYRNRQNESGPSPPAHHD